MGHTVHIQGSGIQPYQEICKKIIFKLPFSFVFQGLCCWIFLCSLQIWCNDSTALNTCLLEEMKGRAVPKGCSHLPAGLWLLQGFGGHTWAKENQGWGTSAERTLCCAAQDRRAHSPSSGHMPAAPLSTGNWPCYSRQLCRAMRAPELPVGQLRPCSTCAWPSFELCPILLPSLPLQVVIPRAYWRPWPAISSYTGQGGGGGGEDGEEGWGR